VALLGDVFSEELLFLYSNEIQENFPAPVGDIVWENHAQIFRGAPCAAKKDPEPGFLL